MREQDKRNIDSFSRMFKAQGEIAFGHFEQEHCADQNRHGPRYETDRLKDMVQLANGRRSKD